MKLLKPISDWNHEDPLAKVNKESKVSNKALNDYALMGSRRSLHGLEMRYKAMEEEWKKNQRIPRPPTTTWVTISNWSAQFCWVERCKEFDEIIRKKEIAAYEEDKKKWREHRLKAAKNLLAKAIQGLNTVDPSKANLAEITRAVKEANEQLRIEFGEDSQLKANEVVVRVVREDKKPGPDGTDD